MFKNRRAWLAARFVLLVAAGVLAYGVRAQDIVVTEMRIPTHASGKKGLEAVMVRPGDSAPHPLALMTHGTPREASEREEMTPLRWIPQAREFARRGWTAVIVMRRGFGDSGGGYDEDGRACSRNPDFIGPTKEAVKDLREAAELSDDPAFANFLRLRADALLTDDYFKSNLAWLNLKNPKFDVAFAPDETYDDGLLGVKATYGAAVMIRNQEESRKLELFQKYSGEYSFDYLMIAAQGYQESLLDQSRKNPSGAVGIMQVIPKNAAASPINIPNVSTADGNIHAGVKMLRDIDDRYFNDPKIDQLNKTLFVFASYNAGPNRIARLRNEAPGMGLDPNVWFNNVEMVAAKDIGQETVTYVSNIYKYYVAYKLAVQQRELRQKAEGLPAK